MRSPPLRMDIHDEINSAKYAPRRRQGNCRRGDHDDHFLRQSGRVRQSGHNLASHTVRLTFTTPYSTVWRIVLMRFTTHGERCPFALESTSPAMGRTAG